MKTLTIIIVLLTAHFGFCGEYVPEFYPLHGGTSIRVVPDIDPCEIDNLKHRVSELERQIEKAKLERQIEKAKLKDRIKELEVAVKRLQINYLPSDFYWGNQVIDVDCSGGN